MHTSLLQFKNRLHVINEELIYLFKRSGMNYVLLHVDYLIDRLTECERIFHSQITQLHEVLRVVTHGRVAPVLISPEEIRLALNEIARKIPVDLQLSFENDFDIWHVYKYSIAILVLHEDEIHLIIKIPLADRDIPVSLIRAYGILIPLPGNVTVDSKTGIFAQYNLKTMHMAISRGYIKELSKAEYDDYVYAAGRFCMALTHMVAVEYAESCLFALYA